MSKNFTVENVITLLLDRKQIRCSQKKALLSVLVIALELFIQMGISFCFSFVFHFSSFLSYF